MKSTQQKTDERIRFRCIFRNGKVEFTTKNVLWQTFTIDDLNNNGKCEITDDQYEKFVRQNNTAFAESCSEIAQELFSDFCDENNISTTE